MAVLCTCGIIPLVVISVIAVRMLDQNLIQAEHEKLGIASSLVTQQINNYVENLSMQSRMLARQLTVVGVPWDQESLHQLLEDSRAEFSMFDSIRLYTMEGELIASSDRSKDGGLPREALDRAIQEGGHTSYLQPPEIDGDEFRIQNLVITTPDHSGRPLLAACTSEMNGLCRAAGFMSSSLHGEYVLLDEKLNLMARSTPHELQNKEEPDWAAMVRGEEALPLKDAHIMTVKVLKDPTGPGSASWSLVSYIPTDNISSITLFAKRYFGVVAGVTLLLAFVLGHTLTRKLSRPFRDLAKAARSVAHGDMASTVPVQGPKEVRQVAQSFNQMLAELADHRDELESLVIGRTRSLAESQQQLASVTAQLQASYEAAREGILVVHHDTSEIIALNKSFKKIFGLDRNAAPQNADSLIDQIASCFSDQQDFLRRWNGVSKDAGEIIKEEWSLSHPASRVLELYSAPVKERNGDVVARMWMVRDLTDQRMLEEGLRHAQKMEAVGRLAGGVAHDFNNLLTGIMANISMAISEVGDDSPVSSNLKSAERSAIRAADLVRKMLGFLRQSALQMKVCHADTLSELQSILRSSMDSNIRVEVHAEKNAWPFLGDIAQIEQVLMNLCVNAGDAIDDEGTISIRVQNVHVSEDEKNVWKAGRAGEFVRISVKDDGSGIGPEARARLFEPFFTTKEFGKGTGLGLAMCLGIVEQHNGWMRYETEEGMGTTFFIYLPRCKKMVEKPRVPRLKPAAEKNEATVLLVDDEPAIRSIASSMLKRFGYEVVTAEDGLAAVELIEEDHSRFDLVVMDLSMPRMSGREALPIIRMHNPDLPVIISSGFALELDDLSNDTHVRPDALLNKPYKMQRFISVVQDVLGRQIQRAG